MYCNYNIPKNWSFDWVSVIRHEIEHYGFDEIEDGVFMSDKCRVKIICHRDVKKQIIPETNPDFHIYDFHVYKWQFFEHFENILSYIRTKVLRDTYLVMSKFQKNEWKIVGIEPMQAKKFFKRDSILPFKHAAYHLMLEDYAVASFDDNGNLVQYVENPYIYYPNYWPLEEMLRWWAEGTNRYEIDVYLDSGTFDSSELQWLDYVGTTEGMPISICLDDEKGETFEVVKTNTVGTYHLKWRNK